VTEHRAVFDARVEFTNGGYLEVRDFRIDLPSDQVSEDEIGRLFVASLGLLMTGSVRLTHLSIVAEPHRGTRGADPGAQQLPGRLVELSHVIRAGLVTYPGLPAPEIMPFLTREDSRERYAEGTEFALDSISMIGNTGTYLDSPYHRYDDGDDLAALPLDRLTRLPAVIVRIAGTPQRAVGELTLAALGDVRGSAVLIHSGDADRFGTPQYAADAAYLSRDGAEYLVSAGASLVGIDSVNIDSTADGSRPAHTVLLGAGIAVVEHLTGLHQLPPRGAVFTAAPPRIAGFGTFPVRAYAEVPA
jgi:arylformamidase